MLQQMLVIFNGLPTILIVFRYVSLQQGVTYQKQPKMPDVAARSACQLSVRQCPDGSHHQFFPPFGYHRVPRNQVELDLWVVPEQLHLLRAGGHRFHAARQSWGWVALQQRRNHPNRGQNATLMMDTRHFA